MPRIFDPCWPPKPGELWTARHPWSASPQIRRGALLLIIERETTIGGDQKLLVITPSGHTRQITVECGDLDSCSTLAGVV